MRGVQLSENFDKQKIKKKKGGGERRVVALFLLAEEWFKSIFQTIICIQVGFFVCVCVWGGGGGVRAWQVPLYTNTQMAW